MPKLGTKPALMLGVTAAMVMGVSGVSAQTRVTASSTASTPSTTTPSGQRGGGPGHGGFGADTATLAKKLGVSVADLEAAVKVVRDSEIKPDRAAEQSSQAKTIADALGVEQATVATALEAASPVNADRPTGTTPTGTTPTGTRPPKGDGGPRGGHGFGGPRAGASSTALIAALVKATGKDEAAVKAALTKADAVRDAARTAHQAEFAKQLAAQLKLDEAKVAAAIEAARPTMPARNAKETTSQTK